MWVREQPRVRLGVIACIQLNICAWPYWLTYCKWQSLKFFCKFKMVYAAPASGLSIMSTPLNVEFQGRGYCPCIIKEPLLACWPAMKGVLSWSAIGLELPTSWREVSNRLGLALENCHLSEVIKCWPRGQGSSKMNPSLGRWALTAIRVPPIRRSKGGGHLFEDGRAYYSNACISSGSDGIYPLFDSIIF